MDFKYCKLEIFIPETHISQLQKALQSVDAGHIGNYDSCMSYSKVTSYWRPLDGTSPYIGNVGEISCEPEVKVEVTVFTEKVDETIQVIKEVHPYEEPVINALPIIGQAFKGKRSLTIRQKGDFFYYTTDSDFMHRIVKRKYRQSWNNAYEILRIEGKGSCEYLQWQVPWRCSRSADKCMLRCDRSIDCSGTGKVLWILWNG